jgi:hypothetical protein
MLRLAGALLALAVAGSCAESHSPRCKRVCDREAECVEQLGDDRTKFDRTECASQCTALERDREGAALVDRHIACADAATTCDQLLACP